MKVLSILVVGFMYSALSVPVLRAEAASYSVGVVPQYDTRKINRIWQPILRELSNRTGFTLTLSLSRSIPVFEKQFSAGEFDLVYMNPYHLIVANRRQGYLPLVRDVERRLFGIIVVRKDSPIQNIRELAGRKVAFPAPNALGAALIPRAEFANKYKIKIIPLYVRSHTSVYLNVLLEQAVAGGGVQKTFRQQDFEVQSQLRILYRTQSVAPHPITIHPRVSARDRVRILQGLLALGSSETGRAMLEKIPIKRIGPADLSDYDELKQLGLEAFYIN